VPSAGEPQASASPAALPQRPQGARQSVVLPPARRPFRVSPPGAEIHETLLPLWPLQLGGGVERITLRETVAQLCLHSPQGRGASPSKPAPAFLADTCARPRQWPRRPGPLPARPNGALAKPSIPVGRASVWARSPRLPRGALKPQAHGTLHTRQGGSEPASALSRLGSSPRMPPRSWHRDARSPARIADFRLPIDDCADCRSVFSSAARVRFWVVRA